ncbi:MAG: leucine-rich repeat domain-containing protein [Bacteroidales bacterium]|nr:leucine-rich repeat domain-containing protein [Bacteroidales bacterium]
MDESCTIEATEEELTVPVAKNNEIWYKTSDNQKLTPSATNAFGVAYNDANNVYEKGLGKITFDKDITSFGDNAFNNCSGLTSIEIPNSVTSIGRYAFNGCSGLTSIEIPNSVTSIGVSAFEDCSGLTSIEIPNSVTSIGNYTFQKCNYEV